MPKGGYMNHDHLRRHHYYSIFATLSEFLLAFSLHVLVTLHFTGFAYAFAAAIFTAYTAVTAAYLKHSVVTIKNINRN